MCTQLIIASGIRTVYYSDETGSIIKKKPHELTGAHVTKGIQRHSNTEFYIKLQKRKLS